MPIDCLLQSPIYAVYFSSNHESVTSPNSHTPQLAHLNSQPKTARSVLRLRGFTVVFLEEDPSSGWPCRALQWQWQACGCICCSPAADLRTGYHKPRPPLIKKQKGPRSQSFKVQARTQAHSCRLALPHC